MGVCPSRTELDLFLTDRLPADSDSRLLTHVESCSACHQVLETMTAGTVGENGRIRADGAETLPSQAEGQRHDALPSRIGQYSVIRELGHGGMGVVYLAEQAGLRRLVALKVIRHGINASAEELGRFRAEAEAVARLQHPNIVQIHEVGEQDGVYYLALEYVDGVSLDRWLAGTPQEPRAAARLTETLARAIHHAHERGILHRDLKPANILMSRERPGASGDQESDPSSAAPQSLPLAAVPKITDFGLAKRLEPGDARTQSGVVLGTPSYVAPEQAAGKPGEVTHSSCFGRLGQQRAALGCDQRPPGRGVQRPWPPGSWPTSFGPGPSCPRRSRRVPARAGVQPGWEPVDRGLAR
jgi:serine/threonine protein kinase